ncbi:MAG: PKD domain-containing protein [Prevotellaceae bacterium]|jgi:PKD repeat protein|nr:PKD domain-containing protein [Prevotellaceae bacterium]
MKTINFFKIAIIISALILGFSACNDEEMEALADFSWKVKDKTYEVTFTNLSYDATSFNWEFGDGETSTEVEPVHTYAGVGEYDVTLTVSGKNGTDKVKKTLKLSDTKPAGAITIDGDFNDWAKYTAVKVSESASLKGIEEIKLTCDEAFIYVYAKIDKTYVTGFFSVYMDYDMNRSTGFAPTFSTGGFDGLTQASIEDGEGCLFKYTGEPGVEDWSWDETVEWGADGLYNWSTVVSTGNSSEFEFALTRDMIADLGSEELGLTFYLEDADWTGAKGVIPENGSAPIKLNLKTGAVDGLPEPPTPGGDGSIEIDGNFNDWADFTAFVVSEDAEYKGLKEVRITCDENFIYVYGKMDKAFASTGVLSLYMDNDKDAATGLAPWWFANIGADFLSQGRIGEKAGNILQYPSGGAPGSGDWPNWTSIFDGDTAFSWSDVKITGDDAEFEYSIMRAMFTGLNNQINLAFYFESNWEPKGMLPSDRETTVSLNLSTGIAE